MNQAPDIQQALGLAARHVNAGRLPEAKNICRRLLRAHPRQPVALHLLGVIAHKFGKNDIAVDLITKALAVEPGFALAHNNLGNALKELKQFEKAADHYRKALEIEPNFPLVHSNLGGTLRELGRLDEAVGHYRKALDLEPEFAEAHYNLGNVLKGLERLDEAIEHYRKALAIKPKIAEAHYNLGNALRELGQLDDAMAHYRNALAIKPNFALAHNNLGTALQESGRFEDAFRSFDLAALDSSRGNSLECLYALHRYEEFYRRLDKLIEQDTNDIRAAAISAFASQQLGRADPYPFCKNPMDFVRVYEILDGADDAVGFLRPLADELKSRAANWEPHGKTTKKGFQTPANLFIDPIGLLADLDRLIKEKIESYCTEFSSENCDFIKLFPKKLSLSGWLVRLLKGGHQMEHMHPSGWLSGVFYLQVPKLSNREEGAIEFGLWGYNYPILNESYPRKRYYPKNGRLVLFPSSLFHRTIPFDSNEERISIAFDLIPT